jgi:hypothetical protein
LLLPPIGRSAPFVAGVDVAETGGSASERQDLDLSLSDDLGQIVAWTVGLGALGGFVSDVVYPISSSGGEATTGLENRVTWPRRFRQRRGMKTKTIAADLGFLGPILVGIVAALIAVFAIGVTGPAADASAQAAAEISQEVGTSAPNSETLDAAKEGLSSRVPVAALIPLALIGGFAGHLILQAATTRVSSLLGAAAFAGASTVAQEVRENVEQAAKEAGISDDTIEVLSSAAKEGADQGAQAAVESLGWTPPPNTETAE